MKSAMSKVSFLVQFTLLKEVWPTVQVRQLLG